MAALVGEVRRIIGLALIGILLALPASAGQLDSRDKRALGKLGDEFVFVAFHHDENKGQELAADIGVTAHVFPFIDTVMGRVPASTVLALATKDAVRDIEILDAGLAPGAYFLLQRLELLYRYRRLGVFQFAALNVSLAPSRSLINRLPLRTGERVIQRALSVITNKLDVPVFVAVGNDGPVPGFINPWAKAPGIVAVTAADSQGKSMYEKANRPIEYSADEPWHLFAAWGVHTIGALHGKEKKTPQMLADEKEIDLASIVGTENVDRYSVRSGTSFASPIVMSSTCLLHQFTQHLKALVDAARSTEVELEPHIRAIVDTAVDRDHPAFQYRLADARHVYSSPRYMIDPAQKNALYAALQSQELDLDLRYSTGVVVRFLKAIAQPVPGAAGADGHGFVSFDAATDFIRRARISDMIRLFADDGDPRIEQWLTRMKEDNNLKLTSSRVAETIANYCLNNDLVLPLPLYPSPQ